MTTSETDGRPDRLRRGDRIEVTAAHLSDAGDGVAFVETAGGRVELHAPGLLVDESASVRVAHVSRHHPRAHAEPVRARDLTRAHPQRREPPCRHHGVCTGCPLMALPGAAQRDAKRRTLRARFGWDADIEGADEADVGYRWSSKRVVFGRRGSVRLGSYKRGSHKPAPMGDCLVDHPAIAAAARSLEEAASRLGIEPWRGKTRTGDLRHAWFKTDGDAVLVTLITAAEDSEAARRLPAALAESGVVSGVAWSVNEGTGNAVRGGPPRHLWGRPTLALELPGVTIPAGPLGFLQPNPRVAAMAYRALVRDADGTPCAGARALDLYAGAGVTTALLRERFADVTPCESYPESAAVLGVAPESVATFLARQADDGAPAPELIVANPPRGGMGEEVCATLATIGAPRVHVMSCSAVALARDIGWLTAGGYRLVRVRAFDTLPQTPHVELVAWLQRTD